MASSFRKKERLKTEGKGTDSSRREEYRRLLEGRGK